VLRNQVTFVLFLLSLDYSEKGRSVFLTRNIYIFNVINTMFNLQKRFLLMPSDNHMLDI